MAGETDNESDDFNDLAPLGTDGSGEVKQDSVQEEGSRLDKLLDEHLEETKRDGPPAQGAKQPTTPTQGNDGQRPPPQRQQGQGTNQDDRTQQRGQGTRDTQHTQQTPHTPRNYGSFFRTGQDGAIYDLQGRKVANVGLERRVLDRVMRYYNGMETEHAGAKQRLEAYESANETAKREGLTIEENAFGLRLVAAWKRNPTETINFLLNQARERNIDVSSIQQGGGGVNPAALREAIKAELADGLSPLQPLIEQLQEAKQQQAIREEVSNEIAAFFEEFPDAQPHRPIIGAIMQEKGFNNREAWFSLQTVAAQNGWDLSKPLAPQAQATQQRRNGAPTSDGNSRTVPDMTGRGGGGGGNGDGRVPANSLGAASKDDSWDDIVANSLGFRP